VDVDDSAVQQMVEESVEHAFEDLAARRWIEAKLKANQLISATRKALVDCAEELEADYKTRIKAALQTVEKTAATEDPRTKIGNAKQLQADCAALDEVTKPLAELLMDKVTEAMLRKKGLV
jgi:molecular chaperone DnaK